MIKRSDHIATLNSVKCSAGRSAMHLMPHLQSHSRCTLKLNQQRSYCMTSAPVQLQVKEIKILIHKLTGESISLDVNTATLYNKVN